MPLCESFRRLICPAFLVQKGLGIEPSAIRRLGVDVPIEPSDDLGEDDSTLAAAIELCERLRLSNLVGK
jgi:hypothetical protein